MFGLFIAVAFVLVILVPVLVIGTVIQGIRGDDTRNWRV